MKFEIIFFITIFSLFSIVVGNTCNEAPACGTTIAELDGVPAKSNGPTYQCSGTGCAGEGTYGLQYECVEYVQRYFAKRYDVTPYIWGGNANQLCSTHPSSVEKASGPAHGYAAVLNMGSYGHTAIINKTVSSTSFQVVEQNNHPNGIGTYSTDIVLCYLKPVSASSEPSCAGMPNGWFCGHDGITNGNPNDRYLCSGGKITQTEKCGMFFFYFYFFLFILFFIIIIIYLFIYFF